MKNHALLLAAALLLGCASDSPIPAPQTPSPAPKSEPVQAQGPWRVSLISVRTENKAKRLMESFAAKGYRAESEPIDVAGTAWQRLVFPGQNTREEAQQLLTKLEQEFGIQGGWIPLPEN